MCYTQGPVRNLDSGTDIGIGWNRTSWGQLWSTPVLKRKRATPRPPPLVHKFVKRKKRPILPFSLQRAVFASLPLCICAAKFEVEVCFGQPNGDKAKGGRARIRPDPWEGGGDGSFFTTSSTIYGTIHGPRKR